MQVQDIMSREPIVVREDTPLDAIARIMLEHRIGCVPVVDEGGDLCGIVTEADFTGNERNIPFSAFLLPRLVAGWADEEMIQHIRHQGRQTPARQIMHAPVVTATEDESVANLVDRMVARTLKRFPVVRASKVVGIVTRHDLLRVLAGAGAAAPEHSSGA
jgi:CBS domain-containing protein